MGNSVQSYVDKDGWEYMSKLKNWTDAGMDLTDESYINACSGIVNRGCYNPPCGGNKMDGGADIVLEGDYREGRGWGGKYGYFFGGMQIQGICAYYYGEKHPDVGVELDRCRINSMIDNPRFRKDNKKKPGQCTDGREKCDDCRTTDVSEVMSAHFTICQKPWTCYNSWDPKSKRLCSRLHSKWFEIRRSFESSRPEDDKLRSLPPLPPKQTDDKVNHYGYCTNAGYIPIK